MDATALITLLETFNEKADKAFNSKFNLDILPRNDVGRLSLENGVVTMTSVSDFRDELDAFTLTYRLFMQDNDRISISNMHKAYQSPLVPRKLEETFTKIRDQMNSTLDSRLITTWPGCPGTFRELQDIVIYGELAHVNARKSERYREWNQNVFVGHAVWAQFAIAVSMTMSLINFIESLNCTLINHLRSGVTA